VGVLRGASLGGPLSSKIASIGCPKRRAILNSSGRLGSYLPVSIAFTAWLETASRWSEGINPSAGNRNKHAARERREADEWETESTGWRRG
jgi:hypothetical protein